MLLIISKEITKCEFIISLSMRIRDKHAPSTIFCPPAAPSAPRDLKVLEVTRQHVHLSWEAPEHDGGSPLSGYQVEKRDVSRKTWVKVREPSPRACHRLFHLEPLGTGCNQNFTQSPFSLHRTKFCPKARGEPSQAEKRKCGPL